MNRLFEKTKLVSLAIFGLLFITGCSWLKPQAPQAQVCPPLVCPVCRPAACPAPKIIEKEKIVEVPVLPQTAGKLNLPIVGEVEKVVVHPTGIRYDARIDTGAESSSIHAENIQLIERDGKKYVSFSLRDPETDEMIALERKLERKALIKQKEGESERRYVVKLWLTLGDIKERVDVSLSNRSDFSYPLLVGRNLLTDTAIVDVSRRHTLTTIEVN